MAIEGAILVTGAASGIGLATVDALIGSDVRVVAADCDVDGLAALAARGDARLHCETLDISDEETIGGAIDRGIAALGPLCGVVNSAGSGRDLPALDTDATYFRRLLDINLVGNFVVAREAARRMMAGKGGSIVNITSVSGLRGNAGRAAYGASKGGMDALTRILAAEWAAGAVRVNAIAPGPIDTPLAMRVHSEAVREEWNSLVPLSRYGLPREVASAILFLLDEDRSSYMTGQTLCIDGGFTIGGLRPAGHG